uniref:Uncharacterized protein n=1 Tax=Arundo donax TaxID=35708 RepID=A0A0A9FUK5_ARUDO
MFSSQKNVFQFPGMSWLYVADSMNFDE